ncbi:MAG: hypothetical protein ACTSYI_07410 [Promethearchaeota archaeon]
MDIKTALEKLFAAYTSFQKIGGPNPSLGEFFIQYPTKKGVGFFYVILTSPRKKAKGKKKDLDKVLNKSAKANKPILPKDIDEVLDFLNQNYTKIAKPKDQILDRLENYIAGLRLEIVPSHNLKYVFNDSTRPELFVYTLKSKNQYVMYLNIVAVHEKGLILAHDHQIQYIKEALKKGINPNQLGSLPSLRTGETELEISRPRKEIGEKREHSDRLAAFREKVRQKKIQGILQGEIDEELAFETVIDFSNRGRASIQVEDTPPPPPAETNISYDPDVDTTRDEYGDSVPDNLDAPQSINELSFSPMRGDSSASNGNPHDSDDQTRMVDSDDQTRMVDPVPEPSPSHQQMDIPVDGFDNIAKPAPLPDNSISGYDKPAPMVFPSTSDDSPSVFPIPQPTPQPTSDDQDSKLLEEKELLQEQLETLTTQMVSQLKDKDEKIHSLQEQMQTIQEESDEKIERLRGQFISIQEKVQPLIEENNTLRQQQKDLAQDEKVTENLQLINRNLSLQENLDQALLRIKDLEQLLDGKEKISAQSEESIDEPTEESLDESTEESLDESTEESLDESTEESIDEPTEESLDESKSLLSNALHDSFQHSKEQLEHQRKTQEEQDKRGQ